MKKVLILGVASVQMDAIIELKKMGIKTYACAQANDGPGSEVVDYFELINFMVQEKVIAFIKKHEIDCVYSAGSDLAMPVCAAISEQLGLPCFISFETANICNHKNKMREFLGHDFKGNIQYQTLMNSDTKIILNYPFIMKPSDSQGQRGVRLINNFEEFKQWFHKSKNYSRSGLVIIEDYIDGPEISVNAYMVDGEVVLIVSSDRVVWSGFQGGLIQKHIVPAKILNSDSEASLKDLVVRAAKKLGILNGPLYFQIKISNNEPYIIEVTPRLDGCHMWKVLKMYVGVNLMKLTFEHLIYGNTEELNNYKPPSLEYTLEFMCEAPGKEATYSKFDIPAEELFNFKYYNEGELIRPINGQFEKIGYFIKPNEKIIV
jgi:phosphoribosylamine-glycine ligase